MKSLKFTEKLFGPDRRHHVDIGNNNTTARIELKQTYDRKYIRFCDAIVPEFQAQSTCQSPYSWL
jgi:hypothetical protein